jgi:hypothetical protein
MNKRAALPWAIFGVSAGVASIGLALTVMTWSTPLPTSEYGFRGAGVIFVLTFGAVGAVLASRVPRNAIGWVFCWTGFATALQFLGRSYENYGVIAHPGSVPGAVYGAWIDSWIWLPGIIGVLPLLLLFFPDGRLLHRRWRVLVWVVAIALPLATINAAFARGQLENASLMNPVGQRGAVGAIVSALQPAIIIVQIAILPAVAAFVLRFRRSRGVEREQLKWLAAAAVFAALSFVIFLPLSSGKTITPLAKAAESLTIVAIATVPLAIGVAITRYRLYDIDRIISRTVSYAVVTGLLGSAYVGLVLLLQLASRPFTGGSSFAVAISTLIVAATFIPLRRRVQGLVDRRFNRHRYDAQQTIETFAARLRDQVDVGTLSEDIQAVVTQTMAPQHVSVWLRG